MSKPCNQTSVKVNDESYICNPLTGKWVLKTGKIGKKLIASASAAQPIKPRAKFKAKSVTTKWSLTDSCYHCLPKLTNFKLALFDLDDTILKLRSHEPVDGAFDFIKQCIDDGYHIGIISNQYGITKGKTTHEEIQSRFNKVKDSVGTQISCLYSSARDKYRKPMTGMYDLLLNGGKAESGSFYCGDASGRSKDFAVSDYYFSVNCKLDYLHAPQFIKVDSDYNPVDKFNFYKDLSLEDSIVSVPELEIKDKVVIMLVGPPGAGKSTLSQYLVRSKPNIEIISRDILGTSSKLNKAFSTALGKGLSVILDNTNYNRDNRAPFIEQAEQQGYTVHCIFFDISKALSSHMCNFRVQQGGKYIPIVARHTYYKRLDQPDPTENMTITVVDGIIKYPDQTDMDSAYYQLYNLKE
jgi:bifunctional polynucleotide phosphatase/kinase